MENKNKKYLLIEPGVYEEVETGELFFLNRETKNLMPLTKRGY